MTVKELKEILNRVKDENLEVRLDYRFADENGERWEDDSPIDDIDYFYEGDTPCAFVLYTE